VFLKAKIVLAVLAGLVALCLAQPALAAGSKTFADATGETGGTADITAVKVTNDDAGVLTFEVSFANLPEMLADVNVFIGFNTDPTAGDELGDDYLFELNGAERKYFWGKWDGTQFVFAGELTFVDYEAGKMIVRLNRSHLGGVGTFGFGVTSRKGMPGAYVYDDAPNEGGWSYEIAIRPVIGSVTVGNAAPKAGKRYAAPVTGIVLAGGQAAKPTALRCTAKLAGKSIRGTGPGGCQFAIPPDAKGKKLVITVTVQYRDAAPKTVKVTRTVR
jgi:hypothetical protein